MTAGDARHGRRDNGLVAAEYASAGDVDPRVGEHLLDVLALDGIAAYLRPTTDMHPVTRSSTLPGRPTDRLYVDRQYLATARGHLARLAADADAPDGPATTGPASAGRVAGGPDNPAARGPGDGGTGASADSAAGGSAGGDDLEAAWAQIMAGYDAEVDAPRRSWPSAEEVADSPSDGTGTSPGWAPARGGGMLPRAAPADQPSLLDGLDTFGADLPDSDEDNEGYTPPAPPPLPRPSLPSALGVVGVVGGLIVFLRPDLLPVDEGVALLVGFAAIVAGFVTLVWRLRPGDDGDDPDDGARV